MCVDIAIGRIPFDIGRLTQLKILRVARNYFANIVAFRVFIKSAVPSIEVDDR